MEDALHFFNGRQPQLLENGIQTQYAPGNLSSKNNHFDFMARSRISGIWPQSWWMNQKFSKGNYNYNGHNLDNSSKHHPLVLLALRRWYRLK